MKRVLFAGIITSLGLLAIPQLSLAAAIAHNGLIISPAIEQISLSKGQTSAAFTAQVTNDSLSPITIVMSVDDFTALNSTGTPLFLNNTVRDEALHGLAHWMTPAVTQFTLNAEKTMSVPVDIADAGTMAPGGHYGAVIFTVIPSPVAGQKNFIGANTSVSLLVFLTTDSTGRQAISLKKPNIDVFAVTYPTDVDLVFANTGDTQTAPHGTVVLTDSRGGVAAQGVINVDSGQVLPSTNRLYRVALANRQGIMWPGVYHLTVSYRPDAQTVPTRYVQSFLFINSQILVVVGLIVLIVIGYVLRRVGPARAYLVKRSKNS